MVKRYEICVIIPVFNGERYIYESVNSVLKQSFRDFQIYIIDDGSTDKTVEIVNSICDERVRLFQNMSNKGLIFTLNKGLNLARKFKYIARLDADDICLPNRLEEQFRFMESNSDVGILGTAIAPFRTGFKFGKTKIFPDTSKKIASTLFFYNPISHPSVMLRTTAIQRCYSPDFPMYEDYHLWIMHFNSVKIHNLQKVLVAYRRHENNITQEYKKKALVDHHETRKLLSLVCQNAGIEFSEEEISLLSIISERHRNIINPNYSLTFLRKKKNELLSKLNAFFDKDHFNYLFEQKIFLYLVSVGSKKDLLLFLLTAKNKLTIKLINDYLNRRHKIQIYND